MDGLSTGVIKFIGFRGLKGFNKAIAFFGFKIDAL